METIKELKEAVLNLIKRVEKLETKSWEDLPLAPPRGTIKIDEKIKINKMTEEEFRRLNPMFKQEK